MNDVVYMKGQVIFMWPDPTAGHKVRKWDPRKPGELEKIRKFFEEKLAAGFRPFVQLKDGTMKKIEKFDKEAERIVMAAEKVVAMSANTRG